LDGVGVELDPAVLEEPDQALAMVQRVADRLSGRAAAGQASELRREPGDQVCDEGAAPLLPDGTADVGRLAARLRLNRVEGRDPLQRLLCDRRRLALCQSDALPAGMRPTERQGDALARRGERLVSPVALALQDATIAAQQVLRVPGAAAPTT